MNKLFIAILALIFVFASCDRSGNTNTNKTDTLSNNDVNNLKDLDYSDASKPKVPIEDLVKMFSDNKDSKQKLQDYLGMLKSPVKNFDEIKKIISTRDNMMLAVDDIVSVKSQILDEKGWEAWEKIHNTLASIGFLCVYVEGMCSGVTKAPILTKEIEKFAPTDYKLYNTYINTQSASLGSEYPYMVLDHVMELVPIGERLFSEFPQSEYTIQIMERFYTDVSPLIDVHKVISGNDVSYMCDGISIEAYPFLTEIDNHNTFITKYKNTKLSKITEKVLKNMSEINLDEGEDIYLVVTLKTSELSEVEKAFMENIKKGLDIPHLLIIEDFWYLVYRFYSDKSKAEKALSAIKSSKPESFIVTVNSKNEIVK